MSTKSLLYHGFGLGTMESSRISYEQGTVTFHVQRPISRLLCSNCHSSNIIRRGTIQRRLCHVPIGLKPVFVQVTLHRLECRNCGTLRNEHLPFMLPNKRYTRAFARYVIALSHCMTVKDVANLLGVSWGMIRSIQEDHLQQEVKKRKLSTLKCLAVDELAIGKGRRYVSIVLDLKSGMVVFVGDGRSSESIAPFFLHLKRIGAKIEAVAMDMAAPYHLAVSETFPNAVKVLDRFHVIKLMNDKLSDLRRQLQSSARNTEKKNILKGTRWLLLKRSGSVNDKQKQCRLDDALELNKPLATAYYLKEDLAQFWKQESLNEAKKFLGSWIATALASGVRQLKTMANALKRYREQLFAWYKYRISTGPLEGFNNKAQTMKRQAYGYRNIDFFKLKLKTLHLKKYALVG